MHPLMRVFKSFCVFPWLAALNLILGSVLLVDAVKSTIQSTEMNPTGHFPFVVDLLEELNDVYTDVGPGVQVFNFSVWVVLLYIW